MWKEYGAQKEIEVGFYGSEMAVWEAKVLIVGMVKKAHEKDERKVAGNASG